MTAHLEKTHNDHRAGAAPAVLADREEALAAARKLAPAIAARAQETEELRSVPEQTIGELLDAGLFGLVTPRRRGGSELGFRTLLEVQAEIAAACPSTGWVLGVLSGHSWLASLFPPRAQEEIFADPRVLIASLIRLGGTPPRRVSGGFRWQGGRGRFCSGIDHSQWVLVGGQVTADDETAEAWYFLIPRAEVEIIDDWHAVGLRGTGSKSIVVADSFIPEHRAVRFADLGAGRAPGADLYDGVSYRLPYDAVWPLSLSGATLGAARGALATYVAATSKRVCALPPVAQAGNGPALVRLARATAMVDAAFSLLTGDAEAIDEARPGTTFDQLERARRARNLAFAVQQCREAVNHLFEASGGGAVFDSGPMQRWWRDANASASHVAFTWDLASAAYGRAAIGLPGPGQGAPGPGPRIAQAK